MCRWGWIGSFFRADSLPNGDVLSGDGVIARVTCSELSSIVRYM